MNIIIDPQMDSCTIWIDNKFKFIKGSAVDCVYSILDILLFQDEEGNLRQDVIPVLDTAGIGGAYRDMFNRLGVKYIKAEPLNCCSDFKINQQSGYTKYHIAMKYGITHERKSV